ncbi:DNA repair protein RadA [Eubacteriales bacterium OttesenSCG-928-M02]|nr:DNA repair protein RadA [Eubacteriales bacterium OttesenSCG-928-M02]
MAKERTIFVCTSCGHEESRWMGKCSGCGEWNTMVEERVAPTPKEAAGRRRTGGSGTKPVPIKDAETRVEAHIPTGIYELDRVLGGGFIKGGVVLLGGEPGVGKSTLLLQACQALAEKGETVLYISGEESVEQVAMRAKRLNADADGLLVLAETSVTAMEAAMESVDPLLCVVDSIQTAYLDSLTSAPGSVSQVRESAAQLMRVAKEKGFILVLVGHVTKEGSIAGPRVLEHMVDTVLQFEGERQNIVRVLRAGKNRFGAVDEIGIFEMGPEGMRAMEDASAHMLNSLTRGVAGVAVSCAMEGTRPVLCELQALTVESGYGNPRRMAQGVEFNRMVLMMAVLERRAGIPFTNRDVYMNAVGGIRVGEPASDLAMMAALASAQTGIPILPDTVLVGEVGLSGEVRQINGAERRIQECRRLGFRRVVLPETRGIAAADYPDMELIQVKDIATALVRVMKKEGGGKKE